MNIHELSALENESIRQFVQSAADEGLLTGRVLDYGCGSQPYRGVVEAAGGTYEPYDRAEWTGGSGGDVGDLRRHGYDTVLCTQVIQYIPQPAAWLVKARAWGVSSVVVTYPAAWPVLRGHLWNFTKLGMEKLLTGAGFTVERHDLRLALPYDGFEVPVGYGVIARA